MSAQRLEDCGNSFRMNISLFRTELSSPERRTASVPSNTTARRVILRQLEAGTYKIINLKKKKKLLKFIKKRRISGNQRHRQQQQKNALCGLPFDEREELAAKGESFGFSRFAFLCSCNCFPTNSSNWRPWHSQYKKSCRLDRFFFVLCFGVNATVRKRAATLPHVSFSAK